MSIRVLGQCAVCTIRVFYLQKWRQCGPPSHHPHPQMQARIQGNNRLYYHTVTITSINYVTLIPHFTTYKNSTRFQFVLHLMFNFVCAVLAVRALCM